SCRRIESGRRGWRRATAKIVTSASLSSMATAPAARATTGESGAPWRTHEVFNQAPPLEGRDVFADNTPLVEATEREGAAWVLERASALGELIGGEPQQVWGRQAEENKAGRENHDPY